MNPNFLQALVSWRFASVVVVGAMSHAMAALPAQDWPPPSEPSKTGDQTGPAITIATGQITDIIGAGQMEVTVEAYLKSPDGTRGRLIASTKTDATGDFALVAQEKIDSQEIIFNFTKEKFAPLTTTIAYEESKPAFIGEALTGNLKLAGRVVSAADGKPVAAQVVFENMFTRQEASTAEDGGFEFVGLSPMAAQLEITSAGFGREQKNIRVPLAEPLVILLKPERVVTIRVVDDQSRPISGAVLECHDAPRHDYRTLITNDDGSATLPGLHFDAKSLDVRLSHAEYVASSPQGEKIDLPHTISESSHQLTMVRAGLVTGQIRGAKSDSPLYGARVFAGDVFSESAPRDWTDSEGNFQLTGVVPGSTPVTVHIAGYAPDLKTVEVTAGRSVHVDFALAPARTVQGRVRTTEGEPVVGVEVAATLWRGKVTLGLRAMTDHEGRFVMENAPTDHFQLSLFGWGSETTKVVESAGNQDIEWAVEKAPPPKQLLVGTSAPELRLTTLDGQSISNESLRKKTTLIIFWATWCGPCLMEVPRLIEVHEKFRGRNDFVMIGLSRDFEESALRDHLKTNPKMTWPQAVGQSGGVDAAAKEFGVSGIPSIFLIDSNGKIAATELRDEEVLIAVEKALKAGGGS